MLDKSDRRYGLKPTETASCAAYAALLKSHNRQVVDKRPKG